MRYWLMIVVALLAFSAVGCSDTVAPELEVLDAPEPVSVSPMIESDGDADDVSGIKDDDDGSGLE